MAKRAARGGNGKARNHRTVNLALQGGGAHGAFTWGVLDRFLEDPTILIEGVSGTSAGAMNAVVMADGLVEGGPDGAREALYKFWREVSRASRGAPWQRTPLDMLVGNWSLDYSPGYLMMDLLGRVISPYSLNPLNINPLLTLIDDLVDFDRVRQCTDKKLYISATNVETGRIRIFEREELTAKTVMASACLPFLYQAVEIDGEAYWDGGYMGNPALFPFFDGCQSRDIVIVQINPICRPGVPHTAREIHNRVNEITFNGSLLRELRAINFVARLIDQGVLDESQYKHVLIHVVEADEALRPLTASSKLNAEWEFVMHLFDLGREAADAWIEQNIDQIGVRSTVDLAAVFQGRRVDDQTDTVEALRQKG